MFVLDDRPQLPGKRRIGASLAVVITGLGQVPQMIDDTGADKSAPLRVKRNSPWIAGALTEQLELARNGMDAEQGTGEVKGVPILLDHAAIEDAVQPIKPAV